MSDDHAAAQRRLLLRASECAVALTTAIDTWGRPLGYRVKIQGVVAKAWLEGYAHAVEELKAHLKHTDVKETHDGH